MRKICTKLMQTQFKSNEPSSCRVQESNEEEADGLPENNEQGTVEPVKPVMGSPHGSTINVQLHQTVQLKTLEVSLLLQMFCTALPLEADALGLKWAAVALNLPYIRGQMLRMTGIFVIQVMVPQWRKVSEMNR